MTTLEFVRVLGAAEVAVLLGVSRQRVGQLTAKRWFPDPIARLTMGAVWELSDIERMAAQTGRTLDYAALDAYSSSSPGRGSGDHAGTAVQKGAPIC